MPMKKLTWGLTYFGQFIFPISFSREKRVVAGLRVRRESLYQMSRLQRNQQLGKKWSLTGLDKQFFGHKIVNISLPISPNISFGCSKETSH